MELKEYQKKTLDQVKTYLEVLSDFKARTEKILRDDPGLSIDFAQQAWEKVFGGIYHQSKNGVGTRLCPFSEN